MTALSRIGNGDSTLSTCELSVAKAEAACACAKRLEDVEKIVRQHEQELEVVINGLAEALSKLEELGVPLYDHGAVAACWILAEGGPNL